jgi:hypothetical protein
MAKKVYISLVKKSEGDRPLQRHKNRCNYNMKMDLESMGWEDVH